MSQVFGWGANNHHQISNSQEKTLYEPTHLDALEDHSIISTSAGAGHTLYLSSFGDVFTCGRNREGQCGKGHREELCTPEMLRGELSSHRVTSMCCQAYSSILVTSQGRVYEFGLLHENEVRPNFRPNSANKSKSNGSSSKCNSHGRHRVRRHHLHREEETEEDAESKQQENQVAFSKNDSCCEETKQHDTGRLGTTSGRLTGLAVASDHSQIVSRIVRRSELRYLQDGCEDGVLLDEGVLAVTTKKVIVATPRLVRSLEGIQIAFCAAGDGHVIAVARNSNQMYACGSNDRGQLGDGTRVNRATFVPVMNILQDDKCCDTEWQPVQVAIGQQHNVVLLQNQTSGQGVIFSWGSGALGQLGHGTNARDSLRPRPVLGCLDGLNIISIACGSNHTAAVSSEGHVYMWGHSEYSQLNPRSSTNMATNDKRHHGRYYYVPRKFEMEVHIPRIVNIACTTHATIAIDENGGSYSWGWNAHGVLARGKGRVVSFHKERIPNYNLAKLGVHV